MRRFNQLCSFDWLNPLRPVIYLACLIEYGIPFHHTVMTKVEIKQHCHNYETKGQNDILIQNNDVKVYHVIRI